MTASRRSKRAVRELLEFLRNDALKRLCDLEEIRGARSMSERRSHLETSFGGDCERLIDTLRRVDLSTALNGKSFDLGGREFTLGRVAKANVEELRQAAHAIFLDDWVPAGNGRGPVRGGVIDSYCTSDWEGAREAKPSLVEDDGKEEAVSGSPASDVRASEVDDPNFLEWQNPIVEEAETLTKGRPYAELEQMDPEGSFQERRMDAHLELFQLEAVAAMDRHYARPGARGLLCLATGGGKTRTSLEWLMKRVLARGERILWVTHRLDLLDQVHEELRGLAWLVKESRPEGFSVSRLQGELQNLTGDVVLASAATLARRQPSRQDLSTGRKLGIVVYDEAHRAVATNTYQALTKLLGHNEVPFLGLTATPYRLESGGTELLRSALGETIYEKSFKELIELGFLARPVWYRQRLDSLQRIQVTASEQQSIRSTGDFSRQFLTEFARTPGRTRQIVEHWVHAREHYGKTIVFACDIDHAEALAAEFLRHQVRAESIHNQHPAERRTATIRSFREHGLEVLVNVGILTEGFNVPKTRTVVMARPTLSKALYVQMIGRAARGPKTVPGKDTFYVVDCVDNYNVHGLELAGQAVAADLVRESFSGVVTVTRSVKDLTENEERAARRSAVLGATRLLGRGFDPRRYTLWGELRWSSPSGDVAVAVFNESLYELQSAVALTTRNEWALARQRTQSLDTAGAVRAVDWKRALNDCEWSNTPLQLIALRDLRLCDEDFAVATALHQLVACEDSEVILTWETSELLKQHYPTTADLLAALAALRPQPAPEPAAAAEALPAANDALRIRTVVDAFIDLGIALARSAGQLDEAERHVVAYSASYLVQSISPVPHELPHDVVTAREALPLDQDAARHAAQVVRSHLEWNHRITAFDLLIRVAMADNDLAEIEAQWLDYISQELEIPAVVKDERLSWFRPAAQPSIVTLVDDGYRTCRSCRETFEQTARFCGNCGTSL